MRILALLVLAGCPGGAWDSGDTGDTDTDTDNPPDVVIPDFVGELSTVQTTVTSDSSGVATLFLEVPDGAEGFLVTGQGNGLLAVEVVRDPFGNEVLHWQDWDDSPRTLTESLNPSASDTVLQWPIRPEDGALSAGTWEVEIATVDTAGEYQGGQIIDTTVQLKTDDDLFTGTMNVEIIFSAGTSDDAFQGTQDAVERWREVWAPYGLGLNVQYFDGEFGTELMAPGDGDGDLYLGLTAAGTNDNITVVVCETVTGLEVLGVAGSLPGTLVSSERAVMLVSWLNNAGPDGTFDTEDIRLYGETMAHEVGHYMGLFHPVEDGFDEWDALDDTVECSSVGGCDSELGTNLMYPYPVCGTECVAQDDMSDDQVGLSQRYTGTL